MSTTHVTAEPGAFGACPKCGEGITKPAREGEGVVLRVRGYVRLMAKSLVTQCPKCREEIEVQGSDLRGLKLVMLRRTN